MSYRSTIEWVHLSGCPGVNYRVSAPSWMSWGQLYREGTYLDVLGSTTEWVHLSGCPGVNYTGSAPSWMSWGQLYREGTYLDDLESNMEWEHLPGCPPGPSQPGWSRRRRHRHWMRPQHATSSTRAGWCRARLMMNTPGSGSGHPLGAGAHTITGTGRRGVLGGISICGVAMIKRLTKLNCVVFFLWNLINSRTVWPLRTL